MRCPTRAPGAEETVNGVSRFRKRGRISSSSMWDSNSNSARGTCPSESSYLLLARQSQAPGSLPSAPFAERIQEELGEEGDLGEDDHSAGPVLPKPRFMKSRRCGAAPGQSGSTARSAREDPWRGCPLGDRRLRGGGGGPLHSANGAGSSPASPAAGPALSHPRRTSPGAGSCLCLCIHVAECRPCLSSTPARKEEPRAAGWSWPHAGVGVGGRHCEVSGAWVVREGFREEAGLWWGLRGEERINRQKPLLRFEL